MQGLCSLVYNDFVLPIEIDNYNASPLETIQKDSQS